MEMILLQCGPFITLLAAIILRMAALVQRESSWREQRVSLLIRLCYLMMAVSFVGMILVVFLGSPVGVLGLLLTGGLIFVFVQGDLRFAGVRYRARQVELLWALTLAVKSGRPLDVEIESYAEGCAGAQRRLLLEIAERLQEGAPLSEISFPQGLVSNSMSMQIQAGLVSNSLEKSLTKTAQRVTEEFANDEEAEFLGVLMYPPALLILCSLISTFLMYWIIPKFKRIFDDFGTEFPQITIALIHGSDAIINNWFTLGMPLLIYLPTALLGVSVLAEFYGWNVLLQSFLGRWFVRWYTSDVLYALSQGLAEGLPINKALEPIVHVIGPHKLHNVLVRASEAMDDGTDSWLALQEVGLLKHDERTVLETAQRVGNLPWVLNSLARNIESRRVYRLKAFFEVVQPLMLLPVGLFAAFVALGFFMPLVKLLHDLS
jgi:protein transport protein HofC